jgi:hypothetical protein
MPQNLKETVPRNFSTGYIFADINNDLGDWSKTAQSHPLLAQMAYAYARRIAVQALYAQGLVDLNLVNHVYSIFKGMQAMTGQTVEFQENALAEANRLIIDYHPMATGLFTKYLAHWYQANSGPAKQPQRNDAELFQMIFEHAYATQEVLRTVQGIKPGTPSPQVSEVQSRQAPEDEYYAELSEAVFADLPLHHSSREDAQAHAELKNLKVYRSGNGSYFTAPEGYVEPNLPSFMDLDDDNVC